MRLVKTDTELRPGTYIKVSPQKAGAMCRKFGTKIPSPGCERRLCKDPSLYLTWFMGSYEVRMY
jgi:hypothetical protein